MIPNVYILQWKKHAPWQTLSMVEHDLIISRVLVDLYNNDIIKKSLVFRGGTALNKLYIKPPARYSEDIDLVQLAPGPIGAVIDAIRSSLDFWLGKPQRKHTERSTKLIYRYKTSEEEPAKLKIEINTTEHFQVKKLIKIPLELNSEWYLGSSDIITYQLEELMATKLKALYQRRKGRDLFDWWYVITNQLVDVQAVLPIFLIYCQKAGEKVTRALFEENMTSKKNHRDFCTDMRPLLPLDVNWGFDIAYHLVLSEVVSRIPGDKWKLCC